MSIFLYLGGWSLYFLLLTSLENRYWRKQNVDPKYDYTDTSLVANIIHALILIIVGGYACLSFIDISTGPTPLQSEILKNSIAYFVIDTILLIEKKHDRKDVYIHHAICVTGFTYVLLSDTLGWITTAACVAGEMGIFLYFDLLAKKWIYKNPTFYVINDHLNFYSFSFSRVFMLGFLLVLVLGSSKLDYFLKAIATSFYILGIVWTFQLINRQRRRYPQSLPGKILNRIFPIELEASKQEESRAEHSVARQERVHFISDRELVIITSAGLPWKTGTSINPLIKAGEFAKLGLKTILYIPWISPSEQKVLLKTPPIQNKQQQKELSLNFLRSLDLPEIQIEFYDAELLDFYGILPKKSFFLDLKANSMVLLEEADHLLFPFPLLNLKRDRPDLFIWGVIHTNYPYYWQKYFPEIDEESYKKFTKSIYGRVNQSILDRNTDRLFVLSSAIDFYQNAEIRNLHGVNSRFFHASGNKRNGAYFIGKVIPEKGISDLLAISQSLPDLSIDIYGDTDEACKITQLLRAQSNVKFRGTTLQPWIDLKNYDIFINPSNSEVMCTTTLEAVAMNKYVLLPDVPSNQYFKNFPRCIFYENITHAKEILKKKNFPLIENDSKIMEWKNIVSDFFEREIRPICHKKAS